MSTALRIALHDLRITLTDRAAVLWLFVLPVAFASFFGLVLGGGGESPSVSVRLTVVDEDGGPLARQLVDHLRVDRIELNEVTPEQRTQLAHPIRTLVIPAGFSDSIQRGEQSILRLEKEPDTSQEAAMVAQARILRAAARVIGQLVVADRKGAGLDADTGGLPERPDYVMVESTTAGRSQTVPTGFAQSVPGNSVMFVMLVALTYGAATISGERQSGLIRRLATTPVSRLAIIGGKIGGRLVVALAQITVLIGIYALMRALEIVHLSGSLTALWVVLCVYALAVAPIGVTFGALITDPDRAASVGVLSTMVMAALGGCWWPLEIVSPNLQKLALVFPTGWAMNAAHGVLSFGRTIPEVLGLMAPLVAFGLVFTVIASRALRVD